MTTKRVKSRVGKKFRAAKRKVIEERIVAPAAEERNYACKKVAAGLVCKPKAQPKNAFLHPHDPQAQIPQKVYKKALDLRLTVPNVFQTSC